MTSKILHLVQMFPLTCRISISICLIDIVFECSTSIFKINISNMKLLKFLPNPSPPSNSANGHPFLSPILFRSWPVLSSSSATMLVLVASFHLEQSIGWFSYCQLCFRPHPSQSMFNRVILLKHKLDHVSLWPQTLHWLSPSLQSKSKLWQWPLWPNSLSFPLSGSLSYHSLSLPSLGSSSTLVLLFSQVSTWQTPFVFLGLYLSVTS